MKIATMAHWLFSPSIIRWIDGIVSRFPNKVFYSALNERKIDSGKYKENEVQPPTVNNALSFGDYPKALEDDDIPTPKKVEE